ncbi:hypothetical protein [Streptomyces sp. NPDC001222]|uniref:hypothetical protein n=1 Tax=Streptomyces sp. NPDC001222 TaxID=3364548 RepID=UPI0036CF0916
MLPQFEDARAEAPLALVPRRPPARRDVAHEPDAKAGAPAAENPAGVPSEDAA